MVAMVAMPSFQATGQRPVLISATTPRPVASCRHTARCVTLPSPDRKYVLDHPCAPTFVPVPMMPVRAAFTSAPAIPRGYATPLNASVRSASVHVASSPSRPGQELRIAGRKFQVVCELGRGGFGVVWEALDQSSDAGNSVALKCAAPKDKETLDSTLFEVEVLKQMSECLGEGSEASKHLPRYITHEVKTVYPGVQSSPKLVNIVMTKVAGQPLDRWLYGPTVNEQRQKTMLISELLDGPLPQSQLASRSLDEATALASSLLTQMMPVFHKLSSIAHHRDVSAHNLMVDDSTDGQLNFVLIDFGLAARSRTWAQDFLKATICGTPNYFPPATWMLFTHGHKYLVGHPDQGFVRQYLERLDHHAMGTLALEILFAVWSRDGTDIEDIEKVREAWRLYWARALHLYQQLFKLGFSKLRAYLKGTDDVSALTRELNSVISCLHTASASRGDTEVGKLLKVVAELLDMNSCLSWGELCVLITQPSASVSPCLRDRTFSHRRVWTTDEAMGDVVEVAVQPPRRRFLRFWGKD